MVVRTAEVLFGALLASLLPLAAHAQVAVNEIMYNPQGSDTGREWVELYNTGSADVTMVGGSGKNSWRINDGSNHTLTDPVGGTGRGSLTIPAGGHLIVASDPTEFISGEYAGGLYSVAKSSISLNNTGASISLIDGSGTAVDSFSYTKDLGGNDDGTSLQRQSGGSWLAALPTPGAANATSAYAPPSSDTGGSSSQASSTATTTQTTAQTQVTAPTSSYVPPPAPSLYADAGDDRRVIVGADVEFDGRAYDKNQQPLDETTTRFMWNFGDGATAEGASALHHFDYPGSYLVVLSIANDKFSVSDHVIVTAEPAALSFSTLPDGGVAIENRAGHDLDLSGWIVRQNASPFGAQFFLPEHSVVLAGATMHVGSEVLKFRANSDSSLAYPNGTVALGAGQNTQQSATTTAASVVAAIPALSAPSSTPITAAPATAHSAETPAVPETVSAPEEPAPAETAATSSQAAAVGALPGMFPSFSWWWLGAGGLALVGGAALFLSRGYAKHEWEIEDMGK